MGEVKSLGAFTKGPARGATFTGPQFRSKKLLNKQLSSVKAVCARAWHWLRSGQRDWRCVGAIKFKVTLYADIAMVDAG